jgi:hypothetical protein|tara:strand:- start:179 stop:517 length:339 start_codon:yes stop_codon:yes gene_type:complete
MARGWKVRNYGIICKHLDAEEFFFGADHKVYPCCYLYDDEVSDATDMGPIKEKYGDDFNSLKVHTIKEILNHEWFNGVLEKSIDDKNHELHCSMCWLACGDKGERSTKKYIK